MSYTVLYREFRPKKFSEIVGQDNIVSILKNQIKKDKISHAYLFSGIRGTGKTSTAKVFAKSICCLNSSDGEACGVCASCRDIQEGSASDIIEIDAASNRGINEIRELKENVGYMPSFGKYRVYIIDEVHMLTPEAFNALLKTLEEPPEHIVFIFATTESNKILPTILSRCQRFDFQRIDQQTVVKHLEGILDKKGIRYETRALELIALNTEGALRDALSLLDKAIAVSADDMVSEQNVNDILGLIGDRDMEMLAEAVLDRDINRAVTVLKAFLNKGREASGLISQLIEYYSNKVIAINVDNPERMINKSTEYIEALRATHTAKSDSARISSMIYSLSKLKNDMRFFSDAEDVLTAKIISLCLEEKSVQESGNRPVRKPVQENPVQLEILTDRINALEREVAKLREVNRKVEDMERKSIPSIKPVSSVKKNEQKKISLPSSGIIKVDRQEIAEIEDSFPLVISYIKNRGEGLVGEIASRFRPVSLKGRTLTVYPADSLDMMDLFRQSGGEKILVQALKARLKKDFDVEYIDRKVVLKYSRGQALKKPSAEQAVKPEKAPKMENAAVQAEDRAYYESLESSLPESGEAENGAEDMAALTASAMPAETDFDDSIKEIFLVKE